MQALYALNDEAPKWHIFDASYKPGPEGSASLAV